MLVLLHLLWFLLFETAPDLDDEDEDPADEDDEEEETVRDPKARIKSLESANARLARKLDARDKRIEELETNDGHADALRQARLEGAFLRAAIASGDGIDLDTAWDLANVRGFLDVVQINDDGRVEGMDEMFGRVLDRYPWLANEDLSGDDEPSEPGRRTDGGIGNKRKTDRNAGADKAMLEGKFSALKSRRRR